MVAKGKQVVGEGLVPRLRFPEFTDKSNTQFQRIGAIGTFFGGGTPSRNNPDYWEGPHAWISSSDIYEDNIGIYAVNHHISDQAIHESATKPVPVGAILLVSRVGVGKLAIASSPVCTSQDFTNFVPDSANSFFLGYQLKAVKNVLLSFNQGMAIKGFTQNDISTMEVWVPSIDEQQKIADCLSSLDERIAFETRRLNALKTHKQGLLQQLFPRENETVPCLRFPEFQDGDDWNEVALGDIAEIKLGKMLDRKKQTAGTLLPYLNNLSVRWGTVDTSDLPTMYFEDYELERFALRPGDVVVCEGGEPGRSAVWDGRLTNVKYQKAIHRVRFLDPFDSRFFVLYLRAIAGTVAFDGLFKGGGIKHLTREVFATLKIPMLPLAEQQKIADCLSSLDDLITAQSKKIDLLKQHKRGLMQQLFPMLEAAAA